jgi:hypothetical protein
VRRQCFFIHPNIALPKRVAMQRGREPAVLHRMEATSRKES